jgi:hypothetical protein
MKTWWRRSFGDLQGGAVRPVELDAASGVSGGRPASFVHEMVVEAAEEREVVEIGGPVVAPVDEVMR